MLNAIRERESPVTSASRDAAEVCLNPARERQSPTTSASTTDSATAENSNIAFAATFR